MQLLEQWIEHGVNEEIEQYELGTYFLWLTCVCILITVLLPSLMDLSAMWS